jgi:hypothetical protein
VSRSSTASPEARHHRPADRHGVDRCIRRRTAWENWPPSMRPFVAEAAGRHRPRPALAVTDEAWPVAATARADARA